MEKMKAPAKNKPCPCGSGLKYKRCCLLELEGDRELDELEDLDDLLARPRRSFADTLALLAQPLIQQSDGSPEQVEQVMTLAGIAWNIGGLPRDQQQATIDEMVARVSATPEDAESFRRLLTVLLARFHELFPSGRGLPA